MAFLDFNDAAWQGEIGDVSRVLVGEQARYAYPSTDASEVVDGSRLAIVGAQDGLYIQQVAMNPGSDLGGQINFIENPALTGGLSAAPGVPGTRDITGTLYLPLTGNGNAPYIRNILQSKGTGSGNGVSVSKTLSASDHLSDELVTDAELSGTNAVTVSMPERGLPVRARLYLENGTDSEGNSVALAFASGKSSAGFEITGIDAAGETVSERIICSTCSTGDTLLGTVYFRDIQTILPFDWGAGVYSLRFYDASTTVTFSPYDLAMLSYLSLEIDKGNVPFTYRGMYATGARIEVRDRDELLQLGIEMSGRSAHPYENLAGTRVPDVTAGNKATVQSTDYRTDLSVSALSGLEIISEHAMVGARTFLTIGDTAIKLPVINATLDFGINTERSPVLTGDINIVGAPYRRRRRPVLSGELHFSKQNNLSIDALNAIQQDYVKINFSNRARGGFPYEHEITFRKGLFEEVGDPTVDADIIRQRFSLLGLPSSQGLSDDLSWRAVYSAYEPVRNY